MRLAFRGACSALSRSQGPGHRQYLAWQTPTPPCWIVYLEIISIYQLTTPNQYAIETLPDFPRSLIETVCNFVAFISTKTRRSSLSLAVPWSALRP